MIDRKIDPDFDNEYRAAIDAGFDTGLISLEELNAGNASKAAARIRKSEVPALAIYRGWMLSEDKYALLHETLLAKNITLINSPEEYLACHYLPNSYAVIADITPATHWMLLNGDLDFEKVYELTDRFGDSPIIVKDFVKSQKHNWAEACFIPHASDRGNVEKIVSRFIELQGDSFAKGLVFRKFESLEFLTSHSRSGMPLTKEFRLFFWKGELLERFEYWDEGDYGDVAPPLDLFADVARRVGSNFFTMDIAKRHNGEWIVMELGDGQVSGLPEGSDVSSFYKKLHAFVRET